MRRKLDELGVSRETRAPVDRQNLIKRLACALASNRRYFPEGAEPALDEVAMASSFLAMFDALDLVPIFNLMASAHERAAEAIQTLARSQSKPKD